MVLVGISIEVLKGARVFDHYVIEKRFRETSGEPFNRLPGHESCDGNLWITLSCIVAAGLLYIGTSLLYGSSCILSPHDQAASKRSSELWY
jgi:hypothetical protein